MKKLIFILCLFLSVPLLKAQDVNSVNSTMNNFRLSMLPDIMDVDSPKFAATYDGTPFLEKEWQPGSVTLISGEIKKYSMRYFVYGEQIWLKNEADSTYTLNLSDKIAGITIGNRHFIYTDYVTGNRSGTGILEVMYNGAGCKLLNLHTCQLEKGRPANGYQEKEKDKFQHKEVLYYQLDEQEASVLPRSKKEFLSVFGDKASLIGKYFKDNKLKMKPEDLIKVFTYYDEIK